MQPSNKRADNPYFLQALETLIAQLPQDDKLRRFLKHLAVGYHIIRPDDDKPLNGYLARAWAEFADRYEKYVNQIASDPTSPGFTQEAAAFRALASGPEEEALLRTARERDYYEPARRHWKRCKQIGVAGTIAACLIAASEYEKTQPDRQPSDPIVMSPSSSFEHGTAQKSTDPRVAAENSDAEMGFGISVLAMCFSMMIAATSERRLQKVMLQQADDETKAQNNLLPTLQGIFDETRKKFNEAIAMAQQSQQSHSSGMSV